MVAPAASAAARVAETAAEVVAEVAAEVVAVAVGQEEATSWLAEVKPPPGRRRSRTAHRRP